MVAPEVLSGELQGLFEAEFLELEVLQGHVLSDNVVRPSPKRCVNNGNASEPTRDHKNSTTIIYGILDHDYCCSTPTGTAVKAAEITHESQRDVPTHTVQAVYDRYLHHVYNALRVLQIIRFVIALLGGYCLRANNTMPRYGLVNRQTTRWPILRILTTGDA